MKHLFLNGNIPWNKGLKDKSLWKINICKQCGTDIEQLKTERQNIFCGKPCYGLYRSKHFEEFENFKGKHHSMKTRKVISKKIAEYLLDHPEQSHNGGIKGSKSRWERQIPKLEKKFHNYLDKQDIIYETQKIINNEFTVDAYIPALNLIVEIDEKSHKYFKEKDLARDLRLSTLGYDVTRFNEDNINNLALKGGGHKIYHNQ